MIALCIGHSRPGDSGAAGFDGTSEWTFNNDLAGHMAPMLAAAGLPYHIVSRYRGASYGEAMKWLAGELDAIGATVAVELHFNSADTPAARGHEWLCHRASQAGLTLATLFEEKMKRDYPDLPARGVKLLGPESRGWGFVNSVRPPAVICEPFFGSSARDWQQVAARPDRLASTLAAALASWKGARA